MNTRASHTVSAAEASDLEEIESLLPRLAEFPIPDLRQPEDLWHGDRKLLRQWASGKRPDVDVAIIRGGQAIEGVAAVSQSQDLLTQAPSLHLEVLAVRKASEGRGIAKLLMQYVENRARAAGADTISLHVFYNNSRARAVYEHYGFTEEIIRCVKPVAPKAP